MKQRCIHPMKFTGIHPDGFAGYTFLDWTGDTYHPGTDYNYGAGDNDMGFDLFAITNAVVDGVVKWDGVTKGFGNQLILRFEDEGRTLYAFYDHCKEIFVKEGDIVKLGDVIGTCGESGGWQWTHLHLEIREAIGEGYDFWPKGWSKSEVLEYYVDPYLFIEERKDLDITPEIDYHQLYVDALGKIDEQAVEISELQDDILDVEENLQECKAKGKTAQEEHDAVVKTFNADLEVQKKLMGILEEQLLDYPKVKEDLIKANKKIENLNAKNNLKGYTTWELLREVFTWRK